MGISLGRGSRAPFWASVAQIGGWGEWTGESWPMSELALKPGDGGYLASQLVAYPVSPSPLCSENTLKLNTVLPTNLFLESKT